jgi:hypothetical protein
MPIDLVCGMKVKENSPLRVILKEKHIISAVNNAKQNLIKIH